MSDKRECLICKGDNTKFFEVGIKGCQGKVFTTYCYDCDEISLGVTPDFQIDRETGISRTCKTCFYWVPDSFECRESNDHIAPFYADFSCEKWCEMASGGVDFYEDYKNDVLLPQIEKSFPNHILIEKEEFEIMDALAAERILELATRDPEPIEKELNPKLREAGISRNKKGKLYDKSKGDPYPCRSCFYEDNSKDDNTCGTCHTYSNNGELFRTWRPKEKWEAKLK